MIGDLTTCLLLHKSSSFDRFEFRFIFYVFGRDDLELGADPEFKPARLMDDEDLSPASPASEAPPILQAAPGFGKTFYCIVYTENFHWFKVKQKIWHNL